MGIYKYESIMSYSLFKILNSGVEIFQGQIRVKIAFIVKLVKYFVFAEKMRPLIIFLL